MGVKEAIKPEDATGFDSFFFDQALYGRYRLPFAIAFVTGIVWAFQPVATYYALTPEAREQIQNAVATDWMIHFLVPFLLWILFWVGFVVLGYYLLGVRMQMGRLFKLTGWGIAPFAPAGMIRAAGKYLAYQGKDLPVGVLMGQFPSEWDGYHAVISETAGNTFLVASDFLGCAFVLLSAYIWLYAFKYSTDAESRREVAPAVAVPIVLYVAYVLLAALPWV